MCARIQPILYLFMCAHIQPILYPALLAGDSQSGRVNDALNLFERKTTDLLTGL